MPATDASSTRYAIFRWQGGPLTTEQTAFDPLQEEGHHALIRLLMATGQTDAARRRDLSFPLRWYSIPNLFRYERPQRGRLREHWQLNVDLFGIESMDADIEIISLANEIMNQIRIRLNVDSAGANLH